MSRLTLEVPTAPIGQKVATGTVAVAGDVVGPFLIHESVGLGCWKWTVTHIQSRWSVSRELRTKASAKGLARAAARMDCWDFVDPKTVKEWHPVRLAAIRKLFVEYCR